MGFSPCSCDGAYHGIHTQTTHIILSSTHTCMPVSTGEMDLVEEKRTMNAMEDSLKDELWNSMLQREKDLERNKDMEEQILRAVLLEEKVDMDCFATSSTKKRRRSLSGHIGAIKKKRL